MKVTATSRRAAPGAPDLAVTAAPRLLVAGSLAYLVVPAGLQLAFWLRLPLALLAVGALITAAPMLWRVVGAERAGSQWRLPAVVGVAVSVLAGAGGVLTYSGDWRKHFALLRDLSTESWPVKYELPGGDAVLDYTVGWYLPAAAVGRLLGWAAANVAISAWLAVGVALAAWWVIILVGRRWAVAVLLFFSGLDVLGVILLPRLSGWWPAGSDTIDTWAREWQVPSVLRGMLEAPQHTLPTMVLAGLILGGRLRALPITGQLVVLACAALSSPFAVIAALPFVVLLTWRGADLAGSRVSTAAAVTVAATAGLVYAARLAGPPPGVPDEVSIGPAFADRLHPDAPAGDVAMAFVMVVLFEIVVLVGPLLAITWRSRGPRMLVLLSGATMLGCVIFRVGHNNDLAMRGPVMALFVLAVVAARSLRQPESPHRALLVTVLVLASLTGVVEARRNLTATQVFDRYSFTSAADTAGLIEMQQRWYPERDSLLSQYLVVDDGLAARLLATD